MALIVRVLLWCCVFGIIILTSGNTAFSEESPVITFGIVPQQSATRLAKQWTPLTTYLSKQTGVHVIFKTAPNIPKFEQRLLEGEYDIAYMNPYHYTVFHEAPGYEAIAKEKDKKIQGLIIVQKSSPIMSIEELQNEKIAFPAPAAFAASVLPRFSLAKQNIMIEPVYVSSHDSVYLSVSKGLFKAGGGILRTFQAMPQQMQNDLRILWKTEKFTPHAIAVHPHVPRELRDRISQALYSLSDSDEGKIILKNLNFSAIAEAHNSDWNDVRSLEINLLNNDQKQ